MFIIRIPITKLKKNSLTIEQQIIIAWQIVIKNEGENVYYKNRMNMYIIIE